jgi:hypothetical protein
LATDPFEELVIKVFEGNLELVQREVYLPRK